ncbi:uncharacterized protein B0P05DRAFT_582730 [Gilbertella persicaria]|uniref:uncharacterized protein n=1 Tax=Gilbertella persicaria TaxID=101096 RepID=UPI00221F23A1|nr:uncharacterized protein B0P05DRAFT_582730 [Gilbertella persicaria]KAI8098397.1 hypothetical protein B0P05DRAFT_582730 [Gilbertella persicaria]
MDNPFTHLKPSDMLSIAEQDQSGLLYAALSPSKWTRTIRWKRQHTAAFPQLESIPHTIHDTFVLNEFTKQNAAPSNTMFAQEPGLLSSILAEKVHPLTLSKLTTPNLATDVVLPSQPSHSKNHAMGGYTIDETESIFDVPIDPLPQFTRKERKISFINKKPSYTQCICNYPDLDDDRPMIACDSCGVCFHALCIGLDNDKEQWTCSRCS